MSEMAGFRKLLALVHTIGAHSISEEEWAGAGVQAALILALNFPEYAQALGSLIIADTPELRIDDGIEDIRRFVEANPIEVRA